MTERIPNILSIAGSDPSGGAGIQADLKAISALGGYGMAAITALTAQNTQAVTGVELAPASFVAQQIDAVFGDIRVDAVKIGMVATADIAEAIASRLRAHGAVNVVLDPVMVAKSGDRLLDTHAVHAVRVHLAPLATVITPNLPEAAVLLDQHDTASRAEDMPTVARALLSGLGPKAVLLKGGHLDGADSPDLLDDGAEIPLHMPERRIPTANTHGTGCTLSSALACLLPRSPDIRHAAGAAKAYVTAAISASGMLSVGQGHGPVHHFHALWDDGLGAGR